MKTPNIKIEDMIKKVSLDVKNQTANKQRPWQTSCLTGDFYFAKNDSGTGDNKNSDDAVPYFKMGGKNLLDQVKQYRDYLGNLKNEMETKKVNALDSLKKSYEEKYKGIETLKMDEYETQAEFDESLNIGLKMPLVGVSLGYKF